ncbi:MaoC family dehydratase [Nocardia rhamnosiphila]|uniref:MaoC family dehydratase n=1 Tax=Nocardia rhamnosiphila TaxID=426716 RepID=A0ABV2WRC4_9NOCA
MNHRDLTVGAALPEIAATTVRAEDIKLMALILRDPNPIHFDLDAVARAGLGDRAVNQGGSTMAYMMNHLAEWAGSRAAIRSMTCSFRGNVAAGDNVVTGGEITGVEQTAEGTVVRCDIWAEVVGGPRAITGSAAVVFPEV